MDIQHIINEEFEKIGYSPEVRFSGDIENLEICLEKIRSLQTPKNINWRDIIYALAIEIDDIRNIEEWKKDKTNAIQSLPHIAEAFIPNIKENYDQYLVSFSDNRGGLCDKRLGHGTATFETAMGIKESDESSFLLFRDRWGLMMPQTRELCYYFKRGEFTGSIDYLFLGKTTNYPEDKSKPISQHLFPYIFSRYMREFLPEEFKKYFASCIPNPSRSLTSSDWKEETIEAYAKDIGSQVMKTYKPRLEL